MIISTESLLDFQSTSLIYENSRDNMITLGLFKRNDLTWRKMQIATFLRQNFLVMRHVPLPKQSESFELENQNPTIWKKVPQLGYYSWQNVTSMEAYIWILIKCIYSTSFWSAKSIFSVPVEFTAGFTQGDLEWNHVKISLCTKNINFQNNIR